MSKYYMKLSLRNKQKQSLKHSIPSTTSTQTNTPIVINELNLNQINQNQSPSTSPSSSQSPSPPSSPNSQSNQSNQNNQNTQNITTKAINVKQNILEIMQYDIFGTGKEIDSPIPTQSTHTNSFQQLTPTTLIHNEETIPKTIETFFKAPIAVEKAICTGTFIAFDCFSSFILYTPIRIITYLFRCLFSKEKLIHFKRIYDMMMYLAMIISVIIIHQFDIGVIYHYIRTESILKLYALYNALGMFNRLLSPLSIDIQNSLLISIKKSKLKDIFIFFPMTILMTLFHATILFFNIMSLNIAINSKGYALLTMVISNNIVELKGSVFKKTNYTLNFQFVCADIVEMFEIISFLVLLLLTNFGSYEWDIQSNPEILTSMVYSILFMFVIEIVVDSVKHSFISKFNHNDLVNYDRGRFILLNDLLSTRDGPYKLASLDSTTTCARRLGIPIVPLTVLTISFVIKTIPDTYFTVWFILGLIAICYFIKILSSLILRFIAFSFVANEYYRDDMRIEELKTVGRYLIKGGRIPQ